MKLKRIIILLLGFVMAVACKDDVVKKDPPSTVPEEVQVVNKWIYDVLDEVYLWEKYLPRELVPSQQENSFDYFDKMLYQEDKWSYLTDNYKELMGNLDGVYTSYGFSFALYLREQNSNDVIGIVEYVIPNSPADSAGMKRGDIFYKINGTTMDNGNYRELLGADTYELNFLSYDSYDNLVETNRSVSMIAVEIEEDPILMANVIDADGISVGYLMYNSFIHTVEDSSNLVNVFEYFKREQIDELVLDLRYNGGGRTSIATMMASMIAPESNVKNSDIFFAYQWNDSYQNYFKQKDGANSTNLVSRFWNNVPVNLDLNRLYVLTLNGTASASELIINGLGPYLDIVQIGENTYGKYTVSIPIDDGENQNLHSWGMLPIVAKSVNSEGVSDFYDGFTPDYKAVDDYQHPLGDVKEYLLNTALYHMHYGVFPPETKSVSLHQRQQIGSGGKNPVLKNGVMIK